MLRTLLSLLLFFVFFLPALWSNTVYVRHNAVGTNDGSSWGNAFTDLEQAIQFARYGDEIRVAQGRYEAKIGDYKYFPVKNGVRLRGGFKGSGGDPDAWDWKAYPTVLYSGWNTLRCEGTDSTTLVEGFVIQEGNAYAEGTVPCEWRGRDQSGCFGAGIFVHSPNEAKPTFLTVRYCRFTKCTAVYGGGIGVNFLNGTGGLKVYGCEFDGNRAVHRGGGGAALALHLGPQPQGLFSIDSCWVANNEGALGAGINVFNSATKATVRIVRCRFEKNAAVEGGAIFVYNEGPRQDVVVGNCSFYRNQPLNWLEGSLAGALSGFNYTVKNCDIVGNIASRGGGASMIGGTFTNCLFAGNYAFQNGGAVDGQNLTFLNCHFVNNRADVDGGFKYSLGGFSKDTAVNCVFLNNMAGNGTGNFYVGTNTTAYFSHCALDLASCNQAAAGLDTLLGTITCGPGMLWGVDPMLRDTASGDYRPAACSPLLNRGDSVWAKRFGLYNDLTGAPRIQGGAPDIGCYEIRPISAAARITHATHPSAADGAIAVDSVSGGKEPYTFLWSTSATAMSLDNLLAGTYTLTVTDAQGCAEVFRYRVSSGSATQQPEAVWTAYLSPLAGGVPHLWLRSERALSLNLRLVDMQGRTLDARPIEASPWAQSIPLEALAERKGVFYVLLSDGQKMGKVLRFVGL